MFKSALFVLSGAAVVVACNSPKSPTPGVETTSGEIIANKDVVTRLTAVQCEHARECKNFGTDKAYKDEAGCRSEVSHDLESEFEAKECPHGVKKERLDTCVTKTKAEACGTNLSDKIKKADACRKSALCID